MTRIQLKKRKFGFREDPYMTHYRHLRHSRILGVRITRLVSAPSHDISCPINDILERSCSGPEANWLDERTVLDGRPESQNRQIGVAGDRVRVIGMDFIARNFSIHGSLPTPLMQFKSPQGHHQHIRRYGVIVNELQAVPRYKKKTYV